MAVSVRASGAWTGTASTENTVTIPGAGSYQADDLGICVSVWKSYDNAGSIDNGWTEIFDGTGGSTAAGNGSGSVRLFVAYKVFTSGSETNPTVVGDNGCHQDVIIVLQKGATETWDITALSAAVEQNMGTTDMSHSLTTTAAVQDGDWIFALTGVQDDSATFTRATTAISGGGITYDGNVVEYPATHGSTTSGQDGAADLIYRKVTTGVASGASVTVTATLSAAERVGSVLFRVGVDAGATTGSFTANAVIKKTQTGSLTANAVLKKTGIFASFTADVVIKRAQTGSLAADADVKKTMPAALTADAIVKKFGLTGTFTADAMLSILGTGSLTADAIVKSAITGSVPADAVIKKAIASSFAADAVIKRPDITASFLADAIARKAAAASLVADAVVRKAITGTFAADAVIKATLSSSVTADSIVKREIGGSFSADAVIPGEAAAGTIWTTPIDTVSMPATPTLAFLMPNPASGDMHFEIQIDTDGGFPAPLIYISHWNQTGWEYWDGGAWQPVPQSGVPAAFGGNEARYTLQSPLSDGTYYRRVRAGYI